MKADRLRSVWRWAWVEHFGYLRPSPITDEDRAALARQEAETARMQREIRFLDVRISLAQFEHKHHD